MVVILNAVLIDDLPAVEAACAEALAGGVSRSDVGLNLLALIGFGGRRSFDRKKPRPDYYVLHNCNIPA